MLVEIWVTLLANENSVDLGQAAKVGISTKNIYGRVILESVAIADTGADIAICDHVIKNILGRKPL